MTPTDPEQARLAHLAVKHIAQWDSPALRALAAEYRALLAERDRLGEQLRNEHIESLLDVWGQFSEPCGGGDGWAHDMALSTLSAVAEDLVAFGVFEKHPTMDWYRRAALTATRGSDAT